MQMVNSYNELNDDCWLLLTVMPLTLCIFILRVCAIDYSITHTNSSLEAHSSELI